MQLHVKSKQVAWCGIIMAITVILQVFAGIIETSSLFLLAAASFLTGCVERKFGIKTAISFLLGASLLGFILAPQKLYCFTFAGFGIYVLVAEFFREKSLSDSGKSDFSILKKCSTQYLVKGIIYHLMLIIALFLAFKITGMEIIFSADFMDKIKDMPVFVIAIIGVILAEALWLVFDKAYLFFQERYGIIVCGREN